MPSIYASMVLLNRGSKNAGHHLLIGGSDILQAKRHYVVAIHPCRSNKRNVRPVERIHWDLIVAGISIEEGEKLMLGC